MSTLLETAGPFSRPKQEQHQRVPALDGWRGIAILLVLLEHTTQYGRFKDRNWANLGSFGVDIFFVVSGYIITTRLIGEQARSGHINLRSFYLRRAFRILPLVVVYLSVLCLFWHFTKISDFHWQEFWGSLFFVRNYQFAANPRDLLTAHFWSLSIEEHFYLVWPAILLSLRATRALWFAIAGASLSAIWRFYESSYSAGFHLLPTAIPGLRVIQTDARLDGLLLGSALAILLSFPQTQAFIRKNFQKETPIILLPAIIVNLLLVRGEPSFTLYLLIAVAIAYSLTIKEGPVYRSLNLRPLVWVGEISYSLYVWQQLFLIRPLGHSLFRRLGAFPFDLAFAFLAAACSFYLIERPAVAFGRKLYARSKTKNLR